MTPQNPQFNRGIWKDLEAQVRIWVKQFGKAYVVSGPVLNKKATSYTTIGNNNVTIPEYFYKVILVPVSGQTHVKIFCFKSLNYYLKNAQNGKIPLGWNYAFKRKSGRNRRF